MKNKFNIKNKTCTSSCNDNIICIFHIISIHQDLKSLLSVNISSEIQFSVIIKHRILSISFNILKIILIFKILLSLC